MSTIVPYSDLLRSLPIWVVCGRFCKSREAEAVMAGPVVLKITARRGAWTTMTVTKIRTDGSAVKQLLASDKEFLKPLIQAAVQDILEAEMTEALGAEK